MDAAFEVGNREAPKGHALVYFRDRANPGQFLATYLVVLPIAIDPARYVPPAFASRMPAGMGAVAATALPPIPEPVEDIEKLRRIAQHRSDDILDGGTIDSTDMERLVQTAYDLAQSYARLYQAVVDQWQSAAPTPEPDEETVRLLLMNDLDRLRDLARLTGQLRYAIDGQDKRLQAETTIAVKRIVDLLPDKYRLGDYLAVVQEPSERSRRLAALLLERSFKLCNEEYEALAALDKEIEQLRRAV